MAHLDGVISVTQLRLEDLPEPSRAHDELGMNDGLDVEGPFGIVDGGIREGMGIGLPGRLFRYGGGRAAQG